MKGKTLTGQAKLWHENELLNMVCIGAERVCLLYRIFDLRGGRMSDYWEQRYKSEGEIWGSLPSITVARADNHFSAQSCSRILVPGCGYGRNANFFQKKGYLVTGVDISETAVAIARKMNPKVEYLTGSVFDIDFKDGSFDGLYAFNFLHFMMEKERRTFIQQHMNYLRSGGVAFFTVFSEEEKGFGSGKEVEKNTFEAKPGRPAHYFTKEDMLNHFSLYTVLEEGIMEEPENHPPDGRHVHYLRYIVLKV
jgi:SAM-dependent methyltransferase